MKQEGMTFDHKLVDFGDRHWQSTADLSNQVSQRLALRVRPRVMASRRVSRRPRVDQCENNSLHDSHHF